MYVFHNVQKISGKEKYRIYEDCAFKRSSKLLDDWNNQV